jgi:hypothetical protein
LSSYDENAKMNYDYDGKIENVDFALLEGGEDRNGNNSD